MILEACDEVIELFPNTISKWGVQKSYTRAGNHTHMEFACKEAHVLESNKFTGDSGSAARFFYQIKTDNVESET